MSGKNVGLNNTWVYRAQDVVSDLLTDTSVPFSLRRLRRAHANEFLCPRCGDDLVPTGPERWLRCLLCDYRTRKTMEEFQCQ